MLIRIYTISIEQAINDAIRGILHNGYHHASTGGSCQLSRINGVQVPIFNRTGVVSESTPSLEELQRIFVREGKRSFQSRRHIVARSYSGP